MPLPFRKIIFAVRKHGEMGSKCVKYRTEAIRWIFVSKMAAFVPGGV
jgi:hypothetical protein